jgi:hypothetical protein
MKLYTEEQVMIIQQAILCNHKDAIMYANYCLNVTNPIQVPTNEEIEGERMRSYIEEKWKQYRIVTNEEDAWLFKKWLIEQTYGGNK